MIYGTHGCDLQKPKDQRAFDQHYFGIRVPMTKKLPCLRIFELIQP